MSLVSSVPEPTKSGEAPGASPGVPKARPQACERCWKRKQKCDRRLPTCSSCHTLGVECIPRNQDFNTLSELSHTSVIGYVESLKRRIASLEQQASSRKRRRTESYGEESLDDNSPTGQAQIGEHDARSASSSNASGQNTQRRNEDSSVLASMGAIGFLSRNAMAEPRDHADDLPRKFSLGEIISGALAIDGRDPSAALPALQTPSMEGHFASINRDTTISHIRRFFEWGVILPYLNEETFMEHYDSMSANNSQNRSHESFSPLQIFNVHMAIAIGILMSPESAHLSMLSSTFHAISIRELASILRSEAALEHIHCMIMLLLYSLFNSAGGSAWHLLGLTVKTCISLGLHREPDTQADLTVVESNRRKWLFWSVYSLDRTLSLVMDRPLSIQDDDISVRIPMEEGETPLSSQDASKKLPMSRYLILHAQLMSSIRTSDRTSILLDFGNLSHWRDLPPNMDRSQSTTQTVTDLLQQLSCRALTQLVYPALGHEDSFSLLLGTIQDVETETIIACDQFVSRCYNRFIHGNFVGSFVDAYDIFQAAVIFLCLTWRGNRTTPRDGQLASASEIINKASTLVTIVSSRFPALSAFQRVLLALSTRIMHGKIAEHSGKLWEDFSPIIPRRIQRLIQDTFPYSRL